MPRLTRLTPHRAQSRGHSRRERSRIDFDGDLGVRFDREPLPQQGDEVPEIRRFHDGWGSAAEVDMTHLQWLRSARSDEIDLIPQHRDVFDDRPGSPRDGGVATATAHGAAERHMANTAKPSSPAQSRRANPRRCLETPMERSAARWGSSCTGEGAPRRTGPAGRLSCMPLRDPSLRTRGDSVRPGTDRPRTASSLDFAQIVRPRAAWTAHRNQLFHIKERPPMARHSKHLKEGATMTSGALNRFRRHAPSWPIFQRVERQARSRRNDGALGSSLGPQPEGLGASFATASRRCLACRNAAECRRWLDNGGRQSAPLFCPNAAFLDRVRSPSERA